MSGLQLNGWTLALADDDDHDKTCITFLHNRHTLLHDFLPQVQGPFRIVPSGRCPIFGCLPRRQLQASLVSAALVWSGPFRNCKYRTSSGVVAPARHEIRAEGGLMCPDRPCEGLDACGSLC